MAKNGNLHTAKTAKNDEFYTQLTDIEKELSHYKEHFKDKVVFCNCDDPEWSNFWKYFSLNFDFLGLKKLIATHYEASKQSYMLEMWRDESGVHTDIKTLEQNGDFRSPESIELLKEADIVVTNPPFSLFREYVAQLMEYGKKFIVLGNPNAVTYKEIFPLLKENRMWIGAKPWSQEMYFGVPEERKKWLVENKKEGSAYVIKDGEVLGRAQSLWYTNLDLKKRHEELDLVEKYSPDKYPKYDNYDAINVDKVYDIPCDYDGVMGVPITFLDKYNPEQFEIVGLAPERLAESESSLQIKRYLNAIQYKSDGTTCSGNKVNDGPTILHDTKPAKYPYYTSETVPNKYLEVLYARILIRRKAGV